MSGQEPSIPMPFAEPRPWNGHYQEFFEGTQQVKREGEYKDGLKHGSWKEYWPSGQLKQDYEWEFGLKHGHELDWAENGTQVCDGRNEKGKRVGTWQWYHDNGKPSKAYHYDQNHWRQGEYVWNMEDGSQRARGQWLDDKKHGTWTWWHEGKWEKYEKSFHRDWPHGLEQGWYPDGILGLKRRWHMWQKHGLEEIFDEKGKPRFKGEWKNGIPVGEHISWDDDGKENRTLFVRGLPEVLTTDEKKRNKILKKIAKAKDDFGKQDALINNLDSDQDGPYLYYLWKEGHLDVPKDPDLQEILCKAHGLMDGQDLADYLKEAKLGSYGTIFPWWTSYLDELVMRVYARDPDPVDAIWESLSQQKKLGVALVRARFSKDPGDVLEKKGMKFLVKQHVENNGIGPHILWPDENGLIIEKDLFKGYTGEPTELFAKFIEWFGGFDAWVEALRPKAFAEAEESVARVSFNTFRDVVRTASAEEASTLFAGISLDNSTHERIHEALTRWRKDDVDTTLRIAMEIKDEGLRKWPAVCTAIIRLAEQGREPPDELLGQLRLEAESPTFSSSWYTDPLRAFSEEQQKDPAYRLHYVPIKVGSAVPSAALIHQALSRISDEAAYGVIERQLQTKYYKTATAQFLYRIDDPNLWDQAIEAIEKDSNGYHDRVMYGLGDLGAKGLPLLEAGLKRAKKADWKEAWAKAILVALCRTIVDEGDFDSAYDKHVRFNCIKDDYYYQFYDVFMERILYKLPNDRAEAILIKGLESKRFARAFAHIGACPTERVLETAFSRLLELEDKFKYEQVQAVGRGLASLPNTYDWVKWIKLSGGGGGITEAFGYAIGHEALKDLGNELAANGSQAIGDKMPKGLDSEMIAGGVDIAEELDQIEKLRRRAAEEGGSGQRIYVLRRVDDEQPTGINRIGGLAPGVDAERWPMREDEPMSHLFTLDVESMPGLDAKVPEGVKAVSVFCADPYNNEAWEYDNDYTAVLFSTAEQLAADVAPPEDLDQDVEPEAGFQIVPLDVDPDVFFGGDTDLNEEIFRAPARVLGPPIWLQGDEGGEEGFLMQFDEYFVDMNLGDSGVMYVYANTAFWQCY